MALEAILRSNLLFCKRYPMIHTVSGFDYIVEQCPDKTISLKFLIAYPLTIWRKEFIFVIFPRWLYTMTNSEIYYKRNKVIPCYGSNFMLFNIAFCRLGCNKQT